jgi:predicted nuclease of restriction endonuclease-like (RecB) superfamily
MIKQEYDIFFEEVVSIIQSHRIAAVQSVQRISNQLYWHIGELILEKQKEFAWGKSVVEQLSLDLTAQLGGEISWSTRNLWFMRQLVAEYTEQIQTYSEQAKLTQNGSQLDKLPILKQAASELDIKKVKQLASQIPWHHNIVILQKVKSFEARLFYLQTTAKNQYSRAVLLHQINANAYENYIANPKQHNFESALPQHFIEQANESIKSIYSLDFLDINKPVSERELEKAMVENVKRLMLELGYGFCFIGNQYRLSLGEKDYYIDLLFYHRILKCLVAVELKVAEFEPEFVAKLDFYLQLVDEQLKQADDQPSIGILLVPHKDHLEVEYALRTVGKPIGVAQYQLSKQLPKELQGKLPTLEDFKKINLKEDTK